MVRSMGEVGSPLRIARRILFALLFLAAVGSFAAFVWPTLYRYDHISTNGDTYPVRINRLNGDADMLVPDEGWVPVEGSEGGPTTPDSRQTGAAPRRPAHRMSPVTIS